MKVLVVGAKGFLGAELCKVLIGLNHEVLRGVRQKSHISEIEIPLDGKVNLPKWNIPDLIIDVSNRYLTKESNDAITAMSKTIIGISKTISRSNENWNAPVFQTTSYLQHCPIELQPWSAYAEIRNRALEILHLGAASTEGVLHEFVLHDTYGESQREKFLDLCVGAIKNRRSLAAGEGNSMINLTHINDICEFVIEQIPSTTTQFNQFIRWDIRSSDTYSLRSLVSLLENLSGTSNIVEWGKLENPRREILELWEIPNSRDDFKNKTLLKAWLSAKFANGL